MLREGFEKTRQDLLAILLKDGQKSYKSTEKPASALKPEPCQIFLGALRKDGL